jgi:hypothetical protein
MEARWSEDAEEGRRRRTRAFKARRGGRLGREGRSQVRAPSRVWIEDAEEGRRRRTRAREDTLSKREGVVSPSLVWHVGNPLRLEFGAREGHNYKRRITS